MDDSQVILDADEGMIIDEVETGIENLALGKRVWFLGRVGW